MRARFLPFLSVAVALACGGGPTASPPPGSPAGMSTAAAAGSGTVGSPDEAHGKTAPAEFHGQMTSITSTNMTADLEKLGLDPKNLPPLSKLEPKTLRKLMKTFTQALGVKCGDCHDEQDFAAPTEAKKIADGMWEHYVRVMTTDAGGLVYCDSCHQGRAKMLDRSNKKLLSKWMEENYEGKIKGKDGKDNECATCHGDPHENDIFRNIWHTKG